MIALPDRRCGLVLTALLFGATGAWAQQAYDPMAAATGYVQAPDDPESVARDPEFDNLPATEGMEDTYYQCTVCHSTAIIKQQHLSDARWTYLWDWMVKEQGMHEPDDDTRDVILAYLMRHFSSER